MRLQNLHLEQFRSYERLDLSFGDDDLHVFIGPNGAGKTNLLEAIGLLSLTKSPQGFEETDLFRWSQTFYRVSADLQDRSGEALNLEVASQLEPRKRKVSRRNGVDLQPSRLVGTLPTVLFLPRDLDLFTGSPQQRRVFLDQLLCQVSPEYLAALSQYQKILKQRNQLLRRIALREASADHLSVWDEQLAEYGAAVTLARLELMEVMQCTLRDELLHLQEDWPDVLLQYDRKTEARDAKSLARDLRERFTRDLPRDIAQQATSAGPHREDWHLLVGGRDLPTFASRGQQRTALLALLFLRVSFLELKRGEPPVVLLDDVFSELDDAHQQALLTSLKNHQVFLTSTHLPKKVPKNAVVWTVDAEGVRRSGA